MGAGSSSGMMVGSLISRSKIWEAILLNMWSVWAPMTTLWQRKRVILGPESSRNKEVGTGRIDDNSKYGYKPWTSGQLTQVQDVTINKDTATNWTMSYLTCQIWSMWRVSFIWTVCGEVTWKEGGFQGGPKFRFKERKIKWLKMLETFVISE